MSFVVFSRACPHCLMAAMVDWSPSGRHNARLKKKKKSSFLLFAAQSIIAMSWVSLQEAKWSGNSFDVIRPRDLNSLDSSICFFRRKVATPRTLLPEVSNPPKYLPRA